MLQRLLPSLFLGLTLLLGGCQRPTRTFAGFTFGGGGNTFNCEPATWHADSKGFELVSVGKGETSIVLKGQTAPTPGQSLALSEATVQVPSQSEVASLVPGGHLVLQTQEGNIVHGSFDFKAKLPDGREFPVVGSFTAEHRSP